MGLIFEGHELERLRLDGVHSKIPSFFWIEDIVTVRPGTGWKFSSDLFASRSSLSQFLLHCGQLLSSRIHRAKLESGP